MNFYRIEGDSATKILKFILPTRNLKDIGPSFTNIPNSWIQKLSFIPNTYRLYQREAGPCGLFAVLHAYMLEVFKFNPKYTSHQTLRSALLEIMQKLRQSFAFCTDFSLGTTNSMKSENRYINIAFTNNQKEAEEFIDSNDYFNLENVTFLLLISFSFLCGPKLLSSFIFPETFITIDGNTDVHFVFLLLTGKAIDIPCNECKILGGILCSGVEDRQLIGFLSVYEEELSEPIGSNFTYPLYETWVLHYGGHFTAIARKDNMFYEYDSFNSSKDKYKIINSHHIMWKKLSKIANAINTNE